MDQISEIDGVPVPPDPRACRVAICVKCKHHRCTHDGLPAGPSASTWFYQICAHPDMARPMALDPVSGELAFVNKNDLGTTIMDDQEYPFCRDVNVSGRCELFSPRAEIENHPPTTAKNGEWVEEWDKEIGDESDVRDV